VVKSKGGKKFLGMNGITEKPSAKKDKTNALVFEKIKTPPMGRAE